MVVGPSRLSSRITVWLLARQIAMNCSIPADRALAVTRSSSMLAMPFPRHSSPTATATSALLGLMRM